MNPSGRETDLGGPRRDFPSTCWSRFLTGPADPVRWRALVETLAQAYWKPIYVAIRATWAKSNEDAKDLTQDFFVWMMESGFLSKADPARGRFRTFVRVALQGYLIGDERHQKALKRGGDREILKLDRVDLDPEGPGLPDPSGRPVGDILDDAWRRELADKATVRLEQTLKADGKEAYFQVFRDFHLAGGAETGYREIAKARGLSEVDVSNRLSEARRRFRAIVTDLVAETVQSEEDLRDELKALYGGRGSRGLP